MIAHACRLKPAANGTWRSGVHHVPPRLGVRRGFDPLVVLLLFRQEVEQADLSSVRFRWRVFTALREDL